jgi:probable F420-dependent oxidoreductase
VLLSATDDVVVGTAIASIWTRDATAMVNGARTLAEAWPGRFVLGLGASHPSLVNARGHEYGPPLSAMKNYLDAMDAVPPYPDAGPAHEAPRLLAGTGPRMLELASRRTDGAVPAHMPVSYTRAARAVLGPDAILVVSVNIAIAPDRSRARAAGDALTRHYLAYPDHRRNVQRLGFADGELEGAGSDRVFDAMVIWGNADEVAARVREHFDAGANHVYVRLCSADPNSDRIRATLELGPQLSAALPA